MAQQISDLANDSRNNAIDCHKAAAILMVVGIHTLGYCPGLSQSVRTLLHSSIFGVAVTSFFFIDGFLFAERSLSNFSLTYKVYLIKSINRLLKPWLIFSLLYLIARWLFEISFPEGERFVVGASPFQILRNVFISAFAPQTYFLISLFIIRMISFPLLRLINNRGSAMFLIGASAGILLSYILSGQISPLLSFPNSQEPITHGIWGIQFFLAGAIISHFFSRLRKFTVGLVLFSLLVAIIAFLTGKTGVVVYLFRYGYILFLFFGFHLISSYVTAFGIFGRNSMGMYLIHTPVLLKIISLVVLKFSSNGFISFASTYCIVVIISLLLSILFQKYRWWRWAVGS
jgi:hypothetical protein